MSTTAEYLQELARTAGLTDEEKASLSKVLANQKFLDEVGKGVARQSDYSRNMDAFTRAKTEFETTRTSWQDWYKEASERDAQREEELQSLRSKTGTTTPSTTTTVTPTGLTLKEIQEREGRMINIVKEMGRIASRHAAKFHEELDVDAVEKIAVAQGITVSKAYDEWIKPRVQAAETASVEERIKKAREEGIQEGMSKREVPGEGDKGFHPLFTKRQSVEGTDPSKLTDGQRRDNFEKAWNEKVATPTR